MAPARRSALRAGVAVLVLVVAGAAGWWLLADDDTGCSADAGPTALVAVDPGSGELRWQQRTGEDNDVRIVDGIVIVEARHYSTRIELRTGETLSCVDHPPPPDQAVPTSVRVEGEVDPPPPLETMGSSEGWELRVASTGDVFRQERRVVVIDRSNGATAWDTVLPGFETFLLDDLVVGIDQTGGTGTLLDSGAQTTVTAYEATTGERRWQVPLPGFSALAVAAGPYIVVPSDTEIVAIDRDTGAVGWRADHGSPGQGGDFSEPGWIRDLLVGDGSGPVIAVVRAQQPYRD